MIYLLGKMQPNHPGVESLVDNSAPQNDPLAIFGVAGELHKYWTLGFKFSAKLLEIILEAGVGRVTFTQAEIMISANIPEWCTIARALLSEHYLQVRKFGTILVQTFPELFKNLSRSLNPDGTIVLRS